MKHRKRVTTKGSHRKVNNGTIAAAQWLGGLSVVVLAVLAVYIFQGGVADAARESPFNAARAFADLRTIVGYGPRPAGSEALTRTRDYIVAELRKAGLKPELDSFEGVTPRGARKMVNIRAVRPGGRQDTIALAGHYDTKVMSDFRFVGANDGGSSAAWLLEMARATSGLKLQNNLEFIFFDGEEAVVEWTDTDSLYGSRYDVSRRASNNSLRRLKALVLVDMIGDKDLNIKRELESTGWLQSIIWNTAGSLGFTKEFVSDDLAVSDDHIPYLKAGIPALDLIDFDYGPGHRYWHTAEDTLDKTSGTSLKIVGDVVYLSLPEIDQRISN